MRPPRELTNCHGNVIWHNSRTMGISLRRSPNHFMCCVQMITHHRRGDTRSRTRIGRSKDVCTIDRIPDVLSLIVYATLLTVSIILDSQTSASRWINVPYHRKPSAADSVFEANLTALRTPLPQATLGTYVEPFRSIPTPYGLVSTSQNLVEHQLTLTQPNQVIWYSLEPKNVNDFMSFVSALQERRSERKSVQIIADLQRRSLRFH
jgi:hypothetical protein